MFCLCVAYYFLVVFALVGSFSIFQIVSMWPKFFEAIFKGMWEYPDLCGHLRMPPPCSLEFHEFQCCLSAMITLRANVCFLIYVVDFLQALNNEKLFFYADLASFLPRLIFAAFFEDRPFDVGGRVQLFLPHI